MITVEAHRARILAAVRPSPIESVPLSDALGLVLARPVNTRWPVPPFDNSAMDGYAVRRSDARDGARLRVVADVPAGSGLDPSLGVGEAARIMTGAPVPTDADAIVPLEQTDLGTAIGADAPEWVIVTAQPAPGAHIRRTGEDARADAVAVPAGTELGPWQLSSIASSGHDRVAVHRRARVAVVSTGSELVPPGAAPRRGQIPESNSILVSTAARCAGAEVVGVDCVPDDEPALRSVLQRVHADVIVLSGGASVGAFDVVKAVLDGVSSITFGPVAMQPGKPQGFGTMDDGTLVFCLPGNPVGVAASWEMFVRPALLKLAGHAKIDRTRVIRAAAQSWTCPPRRMQVLPAVFDEDTVRPASVGGSGSHLVNSLAAARGFALVPSDIDRVAQGDPVTVMVLT